MGKSIFKVTVWSILLLICWFNLQPWLQVGVWMASQGIIFPFEDTVIDWFIIGPFVSWLVNQVDTVFAIALWLIVQTLQVMALLADDEGVMAAFSKLFSGLPWSKWVAANSKQLQKLGWCSYLLEAFVCLLAYPPYGDGIGDLVADLTDWALDPYLWLWGQLSLFAVTILLFEGFIWLSCFFYGIAMMSKSETYGTGSAPNDQE